ncbi:NAD(P)-binding domain-containing protein [Staphylococcus simulans]|uniref:NAD(P)-binding domain-containing protein n=1 Tax=Staphylococcus simulans TaxID=1286 RepID=UPI003F7E2363
MSKITVVGSGTMGKSLIRAFMNSGHEVTIVDKNPNAAETLVNDGAKFEEKLDNALDCEFVLLNLPNFDIVKQVITQIKSDNLKGKIVVNTSTIKPDEALEFKDIVESKGALPLESVILSYPIQIGTEDAYLVYSGSREIYDKIESELTALSKPQYVGEGIQFAEIIELSTSAIQYGIYWFALLGSSLCLQLSN